ncbi:hypothetical protein [Streptomyces sp. SPB074]|uniref:hypothetical protein n=1 Tax=Streptomyces sp. (strain SPB074) TaxID=465543 RepID=UPI00131A07D2|nr:hypothetical protein [Streptomyces sp. SPB074]
MANFADWRDRMLRAVWRQGDDLPEEVSDWMSELYEEIGAISEENFCELWTSRTFSMARAAFQVVKDSAEEETRKKITGEEYCYIDYMIDPETGPVGVVRIKSEEVSTPDWEEILGTMAEGVQEFIMSHYRIVWPICETHRSGLHVGYFHGLSVWNCREGATGGHVVKAINPATCLQEGV